MPLYSPEVQTLVTRWKHFHSSSSTISVDDAVPQWVLYCVCVDTRRTMGLGNSWAPALQPGSGTFGLSSLPQHEKKHLHAKRFKSRWWCQAWGANMAAWSGSHLLSTGFWETDFPPRQVPQQRWLCGKISEVKCNKWIKRHVIMWSYLVAIK